MAEADTAVGIELAAVTGGGGGVVQAAAAAPEGGAGTWVDLPSADVAQQSAPVRRGALEQAMQSL